MKNFLKENKSNIIVALVFSVMMFLFAPFDVYISNKSDMWFDIYDIAGILISNFLISIIILLLVGFFAHKVQKADQIYYVTMVVLTLCLYVQGTFVEVPYGPMNDENINWSAFYQYDISSASMWLGAIVIFIFAFYKMGFEKFKRIFDIVLICLGVTMIISGMITGISMNGFENKAGYYSSTQNEMTYSKEQNMSVLILDTYDSRVFNDYMTNNSEACENIFRDFTYCRDTLGDFTLTDYAVPQLLTGKRFIGESSYLSYIEDGFAESPLLKKLKQEDWSVNIYTTEKLPQGDSRNVIDNIAQMDYKVGDSQIISRGMNRLVLFKYAPTALKRFFYYPMGYMLGAKALDTIEGQAFADDGSLTWNDGFYKWDNNVFYYNTADVNSDANQKMCHVYHLKGLHARRDLDENLDVIDGEQFTLEEETFVVNAIIGNWLDTLKENGLYDNSVIVIMADHGSGEFEAEDNFIQCPLLMIKGYGENHDFQISDAPLSYDDFEQLSLSLLGGDDAQTAIEAVEKSYDVDIDRFKPVSIEEAAEYDYSDTETGRRRTMIFHKFVGSLTDGNSGSAGYELFTDYHAFEGTKIDASGVIY